MNFQDVEQLRGVHDRPTVDAFYGRFALQTFHALEPGVATVIALQGQMESRVIDASWLPDVDCDGVLRL